MTESLFPPVSVRALARLIGCSRDFVSSRLADVEPASQHRGNPVYRLEDALPALVRPAAMVAGENIDPDTLAPVDRRAWFDSENRRLQYEQRVGELVPVDEVRKTFARTFSAIREHLLSMPDRLERHAGIDPQTAERVEIQVLALLDDLYGAGFWMSSS